MTKIINLKTGEIRKIEKPKPRECEVCGIEVYEDRGGLVGNIGKLPVGFCNVCTTGIVAMLIERQNKER
tara:strand:- start:332 stop:538 length:207 start_codon:yes stop_codon:yes gene_type:complete